MTEEKATAKQVKFMIQLGIIPNANDANMISKPMAREMIAKKLDEDEDKPKPTESFAEVAVRGGAKPKDKNGKEFHLTEEAIRSNALRCALIRTDGNDTELQGLWGVVKAFEEYIRHGNK